MKFSEVRLMSEGLTSRRVETLDANELESRGTRTVGCSTLNRLLVSGSVYSVRNLTFTKGDFLK